MIPVRSYLKHMMYADSLKVSAVVTDKKYPDKKYLAEDDVILRDPPVEVTVSPPHQTFLLSSLVLFKKQ